MISIIITVWNVKKFHFNHLEILNPSTNTTVSWISAFRKQKSFCSLGWVYKFRKVNMRIVGCFVSCSTSELTDIIFLRFSIYFDAFQLSKRIGSIFWYPENSNLDRKPWELYNNLTSSEEKYTNWLINCIKNLWVVFYYSNTCNSF